MSALDGNVVLSARRLDRLEQLAAEMKAAGGQAAPVEANVTHPEQINALVQASLQAYGRIDALFNNTGFGRFDRLGVMPARARLSRRCLCAFPARQEPQV